MRQIFHILLGLIGLIFMSLSFLVSRILSFAAPLEQKGPKSWVESFVVLYVNKCLIYDADIINFAKLSRAELTAGELQSLIVYLKAYLHKIGEIYEPKDIQDVLNALPNVCNIHATGFQSEGAIRIWCMDQDPEGTKEDTDVFINTLKEVDRTSDDWADLSKELLRFRFSRVFTRQHSEDFLSYTDTMLEDHIG